MKLQLHTTYGGGNWDEQFTQTVLFTPGETENRVINLYPEIEFQTLEGFGGAITDSAAYIYAMMNDVQKRKLMESYFSPARMNYQMVRIPIDSCDFSVEQYEAWTESGALNFDRVEKYILPMLRDAEAAAGRKLPLLLAPWSPPAHMKTNGQRHQGGKLRAECRGDYAEYLCRYIEEYQRRGCLVRALSIQNEPKAVQTWDSCVYTAAEEKAFLRDYLRPALEKHGLTGLEIYLWDHNKERVYEWMRDIIDDTTDPMVTGAAFHWYSGDHFEALDLCRQRFPGKKLILSESCIEFSKFDADDHFGAASIFAHEMLGDLNHGICFFGDWNLLLDEEGGPNYVGNYCLAPFLFDTKKKQLQPQLLQQYMEHFSRTLTPGSVRIGMSRYAESVEATAWKRPDGSLALVLLNKGEKEAPLVVRLNDQEAALVLLPRSISNAVID